MHGSDDLQCCNDFSCLHISIELVITNNPRNLTVCNGTTTAVSCAFTGVGSTFAKKNWRIIKRNNNGSIISITVNRMNISVIKNDSLKWNITIKNSSKSSNLSVGPVDETYNNTSYQCIFTINDTIIESTVGTITVIGM